MVDPVEAGDSAAETASRGREGWLLALVAAASLAAAVGTALRSESLPFDTIVFIRFARDVERAAFPQAFEASIASEADSSSAVQRVASVFRRHTQHPGHSLLILAVHSLLAPAAQTGEAQPWEWSARLVGLVSHGLVVLLSYLLFRSTFGSASALAASAMIGLSPPMLRVASDGLSDSPALATLVLSAVWLRRLVVDGGARFAFLGAAAAGVGYWIRPEVAQLALLALVVASVAFLLRPRARARWAASFVCLAATLAAFTTPYMYLKSSILTKKANEIGHVMARGDDSEGPQRSNGVDLRNAAADAAPAIRDASDPIQPPPPPEPTSALGTHSYWRGFLFLLFRWSSLTGHALLAPVLIGAAVGFREATARADQRLLLSAVVANAVGLPLAVYVLMGYFDVRHAMPMFVLSAGWLWSGSLAICVFLRARLSRLREKRFGRPIVWPIGAKAATAAALGVVLAFMAAASVIERNNRTLVGYQQAGRWLRGKVQPGEWIVDPTYAAPFYGALDDRNPWTNSGTFSLFQIGQWLKDEPRVRWVVASDELLWLRERGRPVPPRLGGARLTELFATPTSVESESGFKVRVYRVDRDVVERRSADRR
jgi:hypothetical protein